MKICRQRGLSLLEVIFSLAIISVILAIVANYYLTQNKLYLAVGKAATQIQQLANVSYEWQTAQAQADFQGISMESLQAAGLLSKGDLYSQIDPWGGAITITADNDPRYVAITLDKIPKAACANLLGHMQNTAHNQSCGNGSYYISM